MAFMKQLVGDDELPRGLSTDRGRTRRMLVALYCLGVMQLLVAAITGVVTASADTALAVALGFGGIDMLVGIILLTFSARRHRE